MNHDLSHDNAPSSTRLAVTYTLQPQDYVALVAFLERDSRKIVFPMLIGFFLLPILTIAVPYWRMSPLRRMLWTIRLQHDWLSMLGPTLGPILLFPFIFAWISWSNKKQRAHAFQTDEELRQPRTIELTPQALHTVTAINDSQLRWDALHQVAQNESYIFLLTTPSAGHAVPKSVFASQEEAQLFAQTAATLWERAHGIEIKAPLPDPRETTL